MASSLYESIFEKGMAKGMALGEAKGRDEVRAATIIEVLTLRIGELDPAVVARIRSAQGSETLQIWRNEALDITDAEGARRLIEKISKVSTP